MGSRCLTYSVVRWHQTVLCWGRCPADYRVCRRFSSKLSNGVPTKNTKVKPKNRGKKKLTEVIQVSGDAVRVSCKRVQTKLSAEQWADISARQVDAAASVSGDLAHSVSKHNSYITTARTGSSSSGAGERVDKASARRQGCIQNLISFVQICVMRGMTDRALAALMHHRQQLCVREGVAASYDECVSYNLLLSAYANQGNLRKCRQIFGWLLADEIKPTTASFVHVLRCISASMSSVDQQTATNSHQLSQPDLEQMARGYTELMEVQNVRLNEYDGCADELAQAVELVRLVSPHSLHCTPPDIHDRDSERYNCHLVDKLNDCFDSPRLVESALSGVKLNKPLCQLIDEQMHTEKTGSLTFSGVCRQDEQDSMLTSQSRQVERLKREWQQQLTAGFQRHIQPPRRVFLGGQCHRMHIYPFLTCLPVSQLVSIMLEEVLRHLSGLIPPTMARVTLHRMLGENVMNSFNLHYLEQSGEIRRHRAIYDDYVSRTTGLTLTGDHEQQARQVPDHPLRYTWKQAQLHVQEKRANSSSSLSSSAVTPALRGDTRMWSSTIIENVGEFFYQIILKEVKIDPPWDEPAKNISAPIPAFYSVFHLEGTINRQVLRAHPSLQLLFSRMRRQSVTLNASLVPMLVPPMPWLSVERGGYLLLPINLVKFKLPSDYSLQMRRMRQTPRRQLFPVFDALNSLANVAWRTNTKVLDVVVSMFRSGGCSQLDLPAPPEDVSLAPSVNKTLTVSEQFAAERERAMFLQERAEQFSLWCSANYTISLANHFRDRVFWLPHNIDFRGRVYPVPPHLSHVNSDLARSMLVFARGAPLGDSGLDWLKIHTVNLTGIMKRRSNQERLQFCNKNIDKILDSADNPLQPSAWWRQSEDPWQTLAACFELAAALRSPQPRHFVSHLPVHQDGSCNGLQHYAALGRDTAGASSVNVSPSSAPNDVYSDVVALVEERRRADAAAGFSLAAELSDAITRKVIKQTVMTTVYGVTMYGARRQIAKQLQDNPNYTDKFVFMASNYLAVRTFASLHVMFRSAKLIQDWLVRCASVIGRYHGAPVEWTSPLGLPVVQPYFTERAFNQRYDVLGEISRHSVVNEMNSRVNVMKQRNALPPNFVHSLDSTHMMLTALFCGGEGVQFASVHDCFWTHAASVAVMNQVCRRQFVALHSRPLLQELSRSLLDKFGRLQHTTASSTSSSAAAAPDSSQQCVELATVLADVPQLGELDINQVLQSEYFFS